MAKSKIADIVRKLAEPVAEELNFDLVDVEYVKEGSTWYLRVYIDKPGGVSLDDCEAMNNKMDPLLDEHDPIPHSYVFEVSSPGLDRPLKTDRDFERCRGELVEVRLYRPLDGKKTFEGTLMGKENNIITIENESGILSFPQEDVALVKRVIQF